MFTTHAHVETAHDDDARRAHLKIVGAMKTARMYSGALSSRSGKRAPTRCYDAPRIPASIKNKRMACDKKAYPVRLWISRSEPDRIVQFTLCGFAKYVMEDLLEKTFLRKTLSLSQDPLEYALCSILDEGLSTESGFRPLALEFGVGEVKSIRLIMDYFSKLEQSLVVGFESSMPLTESWKLPATTPNMLIVPGEFEDTLPNFFQIQNNDDRYRNPQETNFVRLVLPLKTDPKKPATLRLVHISCDDYASTASVFDNLYEAFQRTEIMEFEYKEEHGFYLVCDDLVGHPSVSPQMKAFYEFLIRDDTLSFEIIGIDGRPGEHIEPEEKLGLSEPMEVVPYRALFKIRGRWPSIHSRKWKARVQRERAREIRKWQKQQKQEGSRQRKPFK